MSKKLKVSDFAALVGCSQKTVYKMIERKELITVNEVINGRKITFILVDDNKIEEIKRSQQSITVNNGNCEDTLSNEPKEKPENPDIMNVFVNKLMELNQVNDLRLKTLTDELITYRSQIPLLEDRARKEGFYLTEIKKRDTVINRYIIALVSVIILSVLIACSITILLVIEHKKPPKVVQTEKVVEKVIEKPVYKYIYKK